MFTVPKLSQSRELISERLRPKFQYDQLASWVLCYQKEVADLIDKVCREGVQTVGNRFNTSVRVKEMQIVPYLATEYLDLISDPEGVFLSNRIEKMASWFQVHGVEHDEMGFRNLKAVVETSLTSLRSAKDSFRSIRAPLHDSSSIVSILSRFSFKTSGACFNKQAYQQQVLECLHKNIEIIFGLEDSSDSDVESGFESVFVKKIKKDSTGQVQLSTSQCSQSRGAESPIRIEESSSACAIQSELSKLHPAAQHKVLKSTVKSFQRDVHEIINEICQREVEESRENRMLDSPFIVVEYLDLVLEPKADCLLTQIKRINSWFEDHSIKHDFGFARLRAVVEMNLVALKSAKNMFRSMRAPKKTESTWLTMLQRFSHSDDANYDVQAYRQQVMEVLHRSRLEALDRERFSLTRMDAPSEVFHERSALKIQEGSVSERSQIVTLFSDVRDASNPTFRNFKEQHIEGENVGSSIELDLYSSSDEESSSSGFKKIFRSI